MEQASERRVMGLDGLGRLVAALWERGYEVVGPPRRRSGARCRRAFPSARRRRSRPRRRPPRRRALPRAAWPLGTHDAGVAEALVLAAVLGRLPARLRIYTIEGVDFTLGKVGLTPAVASAVEAVAREILAGPAGTDAVGQAPAGREPVDRAEVG